jgi:RsiW-degrading membrane proteinase PrsW (M82 family)
MSRKGLVLDRIATVLSQIAGTPKLEGFNLREIFSETLRHRTVSEIEDYLIVGTARTTPPISEVSTSWPRPWLFARCFLLFGLVYLGFVFAYTHFRAIDLAPALMVMGAAVGPVSTLVLFFELNTPRNVSLYRVVVLVALGGVAALLISYIGYDLANLGWFSAIGAGVIEECGKLCALIFLTRGWRHGYLLNGMLFGASVGAGFAVYESAGYAFQIRLDSGSGVAMMANLVQRGLLAPLMHVTWTAMVGAAWWRACADKTRSKRRWMDKRFYGVLALTIFLHTLWNALGDEWLILQALLLGGLAWLVICGLAQQGLREIREEQIRLQPEPLK